jgi:predicted nucleotidyltransferase component of viral defense system
MSRISNLPASVRQRLFNFAKEKGEDFNFVLTRYALERLLYRLSISPYKNRFLLKGAFLFTVWFDVSHRPTRDLDLLGFGANDIPELEKIFISLCNIESEDGLIYLAATVKGGDIREGEEYQGVRIVMTAMLGNARIPLQIDIGFGDAVTPQPQEETIPVILDFPAPKLKVYPKYTVVAEKFEAMVKLGIANSRLKDFWDLRLLVNRFEFDGTLLQQAITATFARRSTELPKTIPTALTDDFANDTTKQTQWKAFLKKNKLEATMDFVEVVTLLRLFLMPIIENQGRIFKASWSPADGWQE